MNLKLIKEILEFRFHELKSANSTNERLINSYNILLHGDSLSLSKSWWVSVLISDLCNINEKYSPKLSFDDFKSYINFIKMKK